MLVHIIFQLQINLNRMPIFTAFSETENMIQLSSYLLFSFKPQEQGDELNILLCSSCVIMLVKVLFLLHSFSIHSKSLLHAHPLTPPMMNMIDALAHVVTLSFSSEWLITYSPKYLYIYYTVSGIYQLYNF